MRLSRRGRVLATSTLTLVCLIFLVPILWMLDLALKTDQEIAAFPTVWLPKLPQWHNFARAFTYIDFPGYARNSIIISVISTVLTVLFSSLIAFGLARCRARGKKVVFGAVVGTMMLPAIVTTIPVYIIFARLHLTDTYWPWVLMGIGGSAYLVFLIRQGYLSVPIEIEDAAIVDGCNYFQIWYRMYLPMSKAVLACACVLHFVFSWGDFILPNLLLSTDTTTLAVAVTSQYVDSQQHVQQPLLAAGALMFALPVIVVFLLLQRYFVRGFATSGLK